MPEERPLSSASVDRETPFKRLLSAYRCSSKAKAVTLLLLAFLAGSGLLDSLFEALTIGLIPGHAETYLADVRNRATVAFLAARGINIVLSALQTAEVSVLVGSMQVGMVLAPINSLIDSFSDIMLFSAIFAGLQEMILHIGNKIGFALFLPLGLTLSALTYCPNLNGAVLPLKKAGRMMILLALFAELLMPTIAAVGAGITNRYLMEDYTTSMAAVKEIGAGLTAESSLPSPPADPPVAETPPESPATLFDDMLEVAGWKKAAAYLDETTRKVSASLPSVSLPNLAGLEKDFSAMTDHLMRLIRITLFENLVLPFLTFLFFYTILRFFRVKREDVAAL